MINNFRSYGVPLTELDVSKHIASSKKDHITNLVREYFQNQDANTHDQFILSLLDNFPKFQLKWFQENPDSTKIIDLQQMLEFQQDPQHALVFTSMFPDPIMNFLTHQFQRQGMFPNAILNASTECTRSDLVKKAMAKFPAQKTSFLVDTISDACEIGTKFPKVDVIGVIGYSAESRHNLASRFVKEANVKEVIHSFRYY